MDYIKYRFNFDGDQEILLAYLTDLPFDTFEEKPYGIDAYIPSNHDLKHVEAGLKKLGEQFSFSIEKETIPSQNWNEVWESNFETIQVGNFCGIRADFHPPFEQVEHEIIINPKMAFGTGHHSTTYMVIQSMQKIDFEGLKVLDYGCGTGVLAILASMKGAKWVDAVDIEEASYENTLENCHTNAIQSVHTYHGTLEAVKDTGYDLILANINRNVILESFSALRNKLKTNGKLIISGILTNDEGVIRKEATKQDFQMVEKMERNNWICIILERF